MITSAIIVKLSLLHDFLHAERSLLSRAHLHPPGSCLPSGKPAPTPTEWGYVLKEFEVRHSLDTETHSSLLSSHSWVGVQISQPATTVPLNSSVVIERILRMSAIKTRPRQSVLRAAAVSFLLVIGLTLIPVLPASASTWHVTKTTRGCYSASYGYVCKTAKTYKRVHDSSCKSVGLNGLHYSYMVSWYTWCYKNVVTYTIS